MKLFKTSKEIVDNFSQKFNEMAEISSNLNNEQALSVFEGWEKVIGDKKLAAYCELYDIKNETAIIKTGHTGWSQQLLMQKKKILYNFKKFYPALDIKNISVFVEPDFQLQSKIITPDEVELKKKYSVEEQDKKASELDLPKTLPPELAKALKSLKKAVLTKNK